MRTRVEIPVVGFGLCRESIDLNGDQSATASDREPARFQLTLGRTLDSARRVFDLEPKSCCFSEGVGPPGLVFVRLQILDGDFYSNCVSAFDRLYVLLWNIGNR